MDCSYGKYLGGQVETLEQASMVWNALLGSDTTREAWLGIDLTDRLQPLEVALQASDQRRATWKKYEQYVTAIALSMMAFGLAASLVSVDRETVELGDKMTLASGSLLIAWDGSIKWFAGIDEPLSGELKTLQREVSQRIQEHSELLIELASARSLREPFKKFLEEQNLFFTGEETVAEEGRRLPRWECVHRGIVKLAPIIDGLGIKDVKIPLPLLPRSIVDLANGAEPVTYGVYQGKPVQSREDVEAAWTGLFVEIDTDAWFKSWPVDPVQCPSWKLMHASTAADSVGVQLTLWIAMGTLIALVASLKIDRLARHRLAVGIGGLGLGILVYVGAVSISAKAEKDAKLARDESKKSVREHLRLISRLAREKPDDVDLLGMLKERGLVEPEGQPADKFAQFAEKINESNLHEDLVKALSA